MKKFGFTKKDDDGDDANRSALFGSRKKDGGNNNPYAQGPQDNDPYAMDPSKMTPYQRARAGLPSGPRGGVGPGGPGGLPSGPRGGGGGGGGGGGYGTPPPAYSSTVGGGGGYGSDRYGSSGGYGSNRYDNNANAYNSNQYNSGAGAGARGPGGYGGLGRANSDQTDENRDALFSGAKERYAQRQATQSSGGYGDQYGSYGRSGAADGASYGGYGERRELTAEEEEEEQIRDTKAQIKQTRMESLQSAQRSLALVNQSYEVGMTTLARLGTQGDRLNNTEKHLDIAQSQNRIAEEKTKELKSANGSMFRVHVANPFTKNQRNAARDRAIMEQHHAEREMREQTRRDGFAANQRMESTFKEIEETRGSTYTRPSAAERSKYAFENTASDDEQEDQIDQHIHDISTGVSKLNMLSRALGREVEAQNGMIDRIAAKSDAVDDHVRMNRERLNRIK